MPLITFIPLFYRLLNTLGVVEKLTLLSILNIVPFVSIPFTVLIMIPIIRSLPDRPRALIIECREA